MPAPLIMNPGVIAGKIALADRGGCTFAIKVKNLQDAGAVAAIIADNVADSPPAPRRRRSGDHDPRRSHPALDRQCHQGAVDRVCDGDRNPGPRPDTPRRRRRRRPRAGECHEPDVPGSSISHWDPVASPNLLMEPAINGDLNHTLDLTLPLLHDLGWLDEEGRP